MQFDALPQTPHAQVSLRPIRQADLPTWLALLSRPEVHLPTSWDARTVDDLADYVWQPEGRTPSSMLRLAIVTREHDRLVGTIGFHTVIPRNRSAELAYDLSPEHWGRGIATQLAAEMVAWGHGQAGLVRVQATVRTHNQRSARVLERVGFQREGLLRSFRMVRGTPGDFFIYSHLSGEALLPGAASKEAADDAP